MIKNRETKADNARLKPFSILEISNVKTPKLFNILISNVKELMKKQA